jgi:hypothetical protein
MVCITYSHQQHQGKIKSVGKYRGVAHSSWRGEVGRDPAGSRVLARSATREPAVCARSSAWWAGNAALAVGGTNQPGPICSL